MDETIVEGKGGVGGCWMEQSIIMWKWKKVGKDNKHKHPSIHPSIHPFTQLGCWDQQLWWHPYELRQVPYCDQIFEMDEMVECLHPYELGQVGHYEFFDINQMLECLKIQHKDSYAS